MITREQKEYIIKLLQEGKEIPEDFRYQLFPTEQKEYELTYAGKMRKEDILANEDGTFPVPLQTEKVFNGNEYKSFEDGWKNMIVFGDNLQFLKTIYENNDPLIKDKVKGKVKLIYIDPPFATTDEFQNKEGAKAYNDKKKGAEFLEFLRKRLIVAREILADDGSIYVHLDQKMGHYIKVLMDEIFGKIKYRNEIVWHYRTGGSSKTCWSQKHDTILFYSKTDNWIFNIQKEKAYTKSKSRKAGVIDYGGGMAEFFEDEFGVYNWVNARDIWDVSYINSQSAERTDYPTQKPEALLERIIKASSNEGDIVLDFFGGSGSTIATAEKLNRKWITCDLGKLSYFTMQKRILQIQNSKDLGDPKKKYNKKAKSFITASLGSYDLEKTFELERKKYLEFVSGLFEVNLKEYKVSGFKFEGKKDNYPVMIYDYNKYKDSLIDENYLQNLHINVGQKAGSRIYIVAPINFFDFIDDFIEIDDTKYYFLKIPYHVINELHKKPFAKARQPQSKSMVNNIEEAVGFHFKRPPRVSAEIKKNKDGINLIIKSFETSEFDSNKTEEERIFDNFETLSSVFIDKTYNGKSFEMDEAFFVNDLLPKKPKNEDYLKEYLKKLSDKGIIINFKSNEIKNQIMVVFTDIYGNDFTQTFKI